MGQSSGQLIFKIVSPIGKTEQNKPRRFTARKLGEFRIII